MGKGGIRTNHSDVTVLAEEVILYIREPDQLTVLHDVTG